MTPEAPTPDDVPEIRSALLAHYDQRARDLPWRRDRDPYRILVSEIMLQQTRVETVLGYYDPWLERFPTAVALAEATEDEVMKVWEGLGYYHRARNLHRAAKIIRERATEGEGAEDAEEEADAEGASPAGEAHTPSGVPKTVDGLRELPGVGEYTAGAVASIAFQEVVPAVDGNVRRVLARLHDEPDPKPAWLRERAAELVDPKRPGDWNQALMELGATVCTPRSPECPRCPVAEWCAARRAGTQIERPAPKRKKEVASATFAVAVVEHGDRVLVRRRPADGLLGGLWGLPERELDAAGSSPGPKDEGTRADVVEISDAVELAADDRAGTTILEVASDLARSFDVVPDGVRRLDAVAHRFTHLSATYLPVVVTLAEAPPEPAEDVRWIDPETDESTALPTAYRKVVDAWRSSRDMEQP